MLTQGADLIGKSRCPHQSGGCAPLRPAGGIPGLWRARRCPMSRHRGKRVRTAR